MNTGQKKYKLFESYDSDGRLVCVACRFNKRIYTSENVMFRFTWDDESRITSVMHLNAYWFTYKKNWKAEFNYTNMTVKTYDFEKGDFVFNRDFVFKVNPTIHNFMVWR